MASNHWTKLYYNILDDPKISNLPDKLWRRYIEICLAISACVAENKDPDFDDIAWRVRAPVSEVKIAWQSLASMGIAFIVDEINGSSMDHAIAKSMKYKDYLATNHWARKRKIALKRARYQCEQCGATADETILDVHHLTYDNLGDEQPEDLQVLCRQCHQDIHGADNG